MRLQNPLSVVTPTVDGEVLLALASAARPFTTGELHRLIGKHSHNGIRNVLVRLEGEGILISGAVGNTVTYRFNEDHLAAPAITELASLRFTFLERLRDQFRSWKPSPVFAALFGSAARGEMTSSSDIDLFLVSPDHLADESRALWDENLRTLQESAARWTGNDVRTLEMSEREVLDNLDQEPVLASIRSEGLVLHGSSAFWRRTLAAHS